jgi:hypothetical protein
MGSVYASRDLADQMAGRDRLACVDFEVPVYERGAVVGGGLQIGLRAYILAGGHIAFPDGAEK